MSKAPRKAASKPQDKTAARKEAADAQFAEADTKGAPTPEELEEIRIGQEVRGF